jgi:erythronate-4-phosphate dehydrogenase
VKIVADDKIPFLRGALEPFAEVVYIPGKEIIKEILKDADAILIRTRTRCNCDLLENTAVKFIGSATIGYDHIDTDYCERRNIFWTNSPGCNSSSVRQYIASALFMIASGSGFRLPGKTLGIIGVGNVGSKVESFARSIGMNILLNDPPRARREGPGDFTDLEQILDEADIITVHVPLSRAGEDKTWHMFDDLIFGRMKKHPWFINSSRGEVVSQASLHRALDKKILSGAVIDVWENEPDIDRDLLSKVYLGTPHIAGYSADGKANGTAMVVNALCSFFGLSSEDWYPSDIPDTSDTELVIEGNGKSFEDVAMEAVLHTYDITADDRILRNDPGGFEKQRGAYPLRREFTSYALKLRNCNYETANALKRMGFTIIY